VAFIQKKTIPEEQKPLWEQDFMKTFFRVEPVSDDVTELFPKIISYMDNLKTSTYKNLVNVNFQQYDITSYLNKAPQGK
jgi:c-di-AMP phosphodiesterase-like protein